MSTLYFRVSSSDNSLGSCLTKIMQIKDFSEEVIREPLPSPYKTSYVLKIIVVNGDLDTCGETFTSGTKEGKDWIPF